MSTKNLTKGQLADLFGESAKQIQRYVAEGIPCTGTGRLLRFPWPEVRNWRDDRVRRLERERLERDKPMDLDLARRRKLEGEAREVEIRVERMLGTMVPLDVVPEMVGRVCDAMMPVLQNVPSNYSLRLEELGVSPEDAERVLESIATEITKALQSTADLHDEAAVLDEDAEDGPDVDAGAA